MVLLMAAWLVIFAYQHVPYDSSAVVGIRVPDLGAAQPSRPAGARP